MHSLNLTDIFSTWVEARAVMGKGQIGVLNAMQEIEQALPFKLLGIDSDNGTEFINYHLKAFCDQRQIQFTRGRPYKKDDNAHIEQKNWTHVVKSWATCAMTLNPLSTPSTISTKTNSVG